MASSPDEDFTPAERLAVVALINKIGGAGHGASAEILGSAIGFILADMITQAADDHADALEGLDAFMAGVIEMIAMKYASRSAAH
jgi:urea transporter